MSTVVRLLSALLVCSAMAAADSVEAAFDHFYNLEFDEAIAVFSRLVKRQPDRAELHNHLAQSVLYREMLRAGALESEMVTGGNSFLRREKMNPTPEGQRLFDEAIAASLRLSQAAIASNPKDTAALHALGIAHSLRSNYNFLVRKAWLDSLRDVTAARKLHGQVTALDPANVDARFLQGIHEYVVASLPWTYRALGIIAGFRGDRENGIRTLQMVAAKGDRNRTDAAILLAVIYRREQRFQDAVDLLRTLIPKYPRNYLLRFELAQMYSDLGDGQAALDAIAEVERLKAAGTPGFANLPAEKILYFRATVQFWYRDYPSAIGNFRRVTERADQLDPNTGSMAWLRLGQAYDLTGRRAEAKATYAKAIAYWPASEAAREASSLLRKPFRRTDEL